jgi:predicted thioesterase
VRHRSLLNESAIGSGIHQRVIVSVARFDERVQRKVRGER